MARPLRIEFPGAIYHVMSRGNARQTVFRDDSDYQRLIKGLETVVGRLGWDLLCFVLMPNHFHLLVRTPRPNLSRGMQHPQSRAGQTPARRSPARLALVELSGLRPPAAARWMGGLRGFAFGLVWRVGRQRSPGGGLPAVRRAGTGEGSGKPLSVRGAWLAAGQRDVHRADAIAAERAEKPRRGARSPAVGQPGRGDSPGRSGSVLRC